MKILKAFILEVVLTSEMAASLIGCVVVLICWYAATDIFTMSRVDWFK